MRALLLLALALAMVATPATSAAACRCGEPAGVAEATTTRTCPCCEPGECHCCCSGGQDDAQAPGPRDGVKDCGCGTTAPRLAPEAQDHGLLAPHATVETIELALVPATGTEDTAPCAREVRPPGAGFTVHLRV